MLLRIVIVIVLAMSFWPKVVDLLNNGDMKMDFVTLKTFGTCLAGLIVAPITEAFAYRIKHGPKPENDKS